MWKGIAEFASFGLYINSVIINQSRGYLTNIR